RPDPVRAGPAEDAFRKNHAPHSAQDRRGRTLEPWRHLDLGRSRRGRRSRQEPPEQEGRIGVSRATSHKKQKAPDRSGAFFRCCSAVSRERAQRTIVCLCCCTKPCFGNVFIDVVGSLFDGPLFWMVFGPSNCGRTITFGLTGLTRPVVPPTGMRPVEPLPVEPLPRLPIGLPIGFTSPPPVTGPLIGSLGSITGLFGVPAMQ